MTELNDVDFRGTFPSGRIAMIEAQVAELSKKLGRLLPGPSVPFHSDGVARDPWPLSQPTSFAIGRAKVVREQLRRRRKRGSHFSEHLFADPAWDMLLDLYAAHYESREVSVSSLCIAAAVPATTALRWIKSMEEQGLFERSHDPVDGRRVFIRIGDEARRKMDDYFDEIGD